MIRTIAVIGAGTMGHGIAHTFSRHGYQVNLYEPFEAVRVAAPEKIRSELQFMVDEGYITSADLETGMSNITMYDDLEAAAKEADYTIEHGQQPYEHSRKADLCAEGNGQIIRKGEYNAAHRCAQRPIEIEDPKCGTPNDLRCRILSLCARIRHFSALLSYRKSHIGRREPKDQ